MCPQPLRSPINACIFYPIHQAIESRSVVSESLQPRGLHGPWNSPGQNTEVGRPFPSPGDLPNPGIEPRSPALQAGSLPAEPQGKPKNTGVGSLSLLQWIFPTQESYQDLRHCRRILYQLSHQGSLIASLKLGQVSIMRTQEHWSGGVLYSANEEHYSTSPQSPWCIPYHGTGVPRSPLSPTGWAWSHLLPRADSCFQTGEPKSKRVRYGLGAGGLAPRHPLPQGPQLTCSSGASERMPYYRAPEQGKNTRNCSLFSLIVHLCFKTHIIYWGNSTGM